MTEVIFFLSQVLGPFRVHVEPSTNAASKRQSINLVTEIWTDQRLQVASPRASVKNILRMTPLPIQLNIFKVL